MYRTNRDFLELEKEIKKMDKNLNRFMNVRLKAKKDLLKKKKESKK
jgi:hypothetical protein